MRAQTKITCKRSDQKQDCTSKMGLDQKRADIARFLAKEGEPFVTITIPRGRPLYILDGGTRAELLKSLLKKDARTRKRRPRPVGSKEEI